MSEEKELLYRSLDKLFRNYPNLEINEVKSLTKLREEIGVGKYRIIDWVNEGNFFLRIFFTIFKIFSLIYHHSI